MSRTLIDEYGDTGIVQDRREEMGEIDTSTAAVERAFYALMEYVIDHGADHGWIGDAECPEDDTCECEHKARNEGVNAACKLLLALVAERDAERQRADAAEALLKTCEAANESLQDRILIAEAEVARLRAQVEETLEALTELWAEVALSGNAQSNDFGWPEARRLTLKALQRAKARATEAQGGVK